MTAQKFTHIKIDSIVGWGKRQIIPGLRLCVPFSGGVDSGVCLALAIRAVGVNKVIALHVGHTSLSPKETENAGKIIDFLGVKLITIDLMQVGLLYRNTIQEAMDQVTKDSELRVGTEVVQNSSLVYMATRDIARQRKAMVVGTLDLAEILVGYFPKEAFGGDFLWIGGLLRAEVRQLAVDLGIPHLPESPVVTPTCGSIAAYINETNKCRLVRSERDLDLQLLGLLSGHQISENLLGFCLSAKHKAMSSLLGRPVYYPSRDRETQVSNWLK